MKNQNLHFIQKKFKFSQETKFEDLHSHIFQIGSLSTMSDTNAPEINPVYVKTINIKVIHQIMSLFVKFFEDVNFHFSSQGVKLQCTSDDFVANAFFDKSMFDRFVVTQECFESMKVTYLSKVLSEIYSISPFANNLIIKIVNDENKTNLEFEACSTYEYDNFYKNIRIRYPCDAPERSFHNFNFDHRHHIIMNALTLQHAFVCLGLKYYKQINIVGDTITIQSGSNVEPSDDGVITLVNDALQEMKHDEFEELEYETDKIEYKIEEIKRKNNKYEIFHSSDLRGDKFQAIFCYKSFEFMKEMTQISQISPRVRMSFGDNDQPISFKFVIDNLLNTNSESHITFFVRSRS